MFSMWVFRVGLCCWFVLGCGFGLLGVWYAMFTDWTFRAVCFFGAAVQRPVDQTGHLTDGTMVWPKAQKTGKDGVLPPTIATFVQKLTTKMQKNILERPNGLMVALFLW